MKSKLLPLFLLITSIAFAQFPFNGLVAAYEFQNGAVLADGAAGVNFTQTGTALTEVNNRFGGSTTNAITLNGDYLNRPNIDFTGTGESLSYSFWIKTSYTGATRQIILDDSDRTNTTSGGWNGVSVSVENNNIRLEVRSSLYYAGTGGYNQAYTFSHDEPGLNDGEWHHIVFDVQTILTNVSPNRNNIDVIINFYADGVLKTTSNTRPNGTDTFAVNITQSHDVNTPIYVANISNELLAAGEKYEGVIDDILIYNRILTATEVESIASYGDFCFEPSPSILSAANITNTSADINISDSGTYDIAYHKASESFSAAILASNITTGTTALAGLEEFIEYNVYVRQQCAGNTTPWSEAYTFSTARTIGRIYVDANATGSDNGISWSNAFNNLYEALNIAQDTEEVWIAAGTYTPKTDRRDVGFRPGNGVKVYGGFDGTETQLGQRVIGANETILSGDLLGNDDAIISYTNSTKADNSYQVVQVPNFTRNVVLDRLTITGGYANSTGTQTSGAGIELGASSITITIKNCKIKNNVAFASGGAISRPVTTPFAATLNIESCEFTENLARNGGAIYLLGNASTSINFSVTNSLFEKNRTEDNGSSLANSGSSMWVRANGTNSTVNTTLVNNTFVGNVDTGTANSLNNFNRATIGLSEAGTGRTINATIANSIFYDNETTGGVTARSITGLYQTLPASITVSNSIDEQNFSAIPSGSKTNTSNANPLFMNASTNDYTLTSGSPAVDSGDNSKIPAGIVSDLLGNNRVFNTTVDMGVYEFGATLGVNDLQLNKKEIKVYPNPTTSILNIKMNNNLKQAIVYSVLGAKVLETTSKSLNTANLKSGLYLITIEDETGSITTKRFMKQ
ncbi:LamG-like jellyroll fold domain-containing protein [Oceanihabitans sp. 2_MG-2023]|uniref:T9SS type A sorting domain-containing protein n=1 Tax=Oceanihabitans sp. 2_MG-2023 TaxID=3062661 RepID=UPI0026E3AD4A|nr:T9SS type A sorting domain-containing protein [Oceanihabitans sp. 2_MG-2023]MDO6598423.1 LamG-like jellyroll fold domain-containing protein [Oceanihabitans sp. 2_MG-2023]